MTQNLLETLQTLQLLGYSKHIYQHNDNWYYSGSLLENAQALLHELGYDENDQRIYVYRIICGDIKGVAVISQQEL